jgi:hypothetical protein
MKENAAILLSKGLSRAAVAMFAIGIALATTVHANPKPNKDAGNTPANVAAHLELSGGSVTRMLLVKKNNKEYLLLGFDSASPVALFDVSDPSLPRSVDAAAEASGKPATELKILADTLTVFGASTAETPASSEPKEIRSLSGVTQFIKDKSRGLVYVVKGDGLWILKTKQRAEVDTPYPDYMGSGA